MMAPLGVSFFNGNEIATLDDIYVFPDRPLNFASVPMFMMNKYYP
jgi:hypothetical protein